MKSFLSSENVMSRMEGMLAEHYIRVKPRKTLSGLIKKNWISQFPLFVVFHCWHVEEGPLVHALHFLPLRVRIHDQNFVPLRSCNKIVTPLKINIPSCQINVPPCQKNDPLYKINVPRCQINVPLPRQNHDPRDILFARGPDECFY